MTGVLAAHFRTFALYNRWANSRLYEAAGKLPEEELVRDRGAFFKSVLGTLNHLLVADRIWLGRMQGNSPSSYQLDAVPYPEFAELAVARAAQDQAIIAHVFALSEADFSAEIDYVTGNGAAYRQAPKDILSHFFNHQAHHRGQAHDLICQIAGPAQTPSLDMIGYQRFVAPQDLP